ncbi:hypothetical protein VTK73DRAFT_3343 [Phialemonium thermophilum]|uniref:Cysteine-rich transmembrane CYSTM domain-containing protein n=1 Tax=Phialemonium thermophilum TaxID=223376 RepID=A0ABR3X043_9PEZI
MPGTDQQPSMVAPPAALSNTPRVSADQPPPQEPMSLNLRGGSDDGHGEEVCCGICAACCALEACCCYECCKTCC